MDRSRLELVQSVLSSTNDEIMQTQLSELEYLYLMHVLALEQ